MRPGVKARALTLSVGFSALATLLALTLVVDSSTSHGQGQTTSQTPPTTLPTSAFEYEILPGLPPVSGAEVQLLMTRGWHAVGDHVGVDLVYHGESGVSSFKKPVYLIVKSVRPDTRNITAEVTNRGLVDGSCREVEVGFKVAGSAKAIAVLQYTHVNPSVTEETTLDLSEPNKLGVLARSSWVRVPASRDDATARAIFAQITRDLAAGKYRRLLRARTTPTSKR